MFKEWWQERVWSEDTYKRHTGHSYKKKTWQNVYNISTQRNINTQLSENIVLTDIETCKYRCRIYLLAGLNTQRTTFWKAAQVSTERQRDQGLWELLHTTLPPVARELLGWRTWWWGCNRKWGERYCGDDKQRTGSVFQGWIAAEHLGLYLVLNVPLSVTLWNTHTHIYTLSHTLTVITAARVETPWLAMIWKGGERLCPAFLSLLVLNFLSLNSAKPVGIPRESVMPPWAHLNINHVVATAECGVAS